MKKYFYIIATVLSLFSYACQDNDMPSVSEEFEISESLLKEAFKHELLSRLCHVDTIGTSEYSYRPKYGLQDEKDPTTFLFKSIEKIDSYSFFKSLISFDEADKIIVTGSTSIYSLDEKRTVKHTYIDSNSVDAIIEIDMPEIPMIKRLVYVPAEQWPYNDVSSPFRIGSMWKRVYNSDTIRYICVREFTGKNNPGIMMTFDKGWKILKPYTYYNRRHVVTDCASSFAWAKLDDLYDLHRTAYDEAVQLRLIQHDNSLYTVGSIIKWPSHYDLYQVEFRYIRKGNRRKVWGRKILIEYLYEPLYGGSSHIEFGVSKPDGIWNEIDIDS